jgi:hypothetical protein
VSPSDVAAREGALWVPRPEIGTLRVTGSERLPWLQGVLTADVAALAENEGRWSLLLTKPGKILADVTVVAAKDAVYLGVPSEFVAQVDDVLRRFLIMEDADLADASGEVEWFSLHGPLAVEVARDLAQSFAGHFAAVDWTGLGGAALVVPRAEAPRVSLAATLHPGVVAGSPDDWQRLRVERLVPLQAVDFDDRQNPHEASLDRRAVSWTKGCYLGQEAVCMQDMRGKVKRRIGILKLDADGALPPKGTEVTDPAGAIVGEIRSAAESAVFGGRAALAVLAASATAAGTPLLVAGTPAMVVEPR